MKEDTYNKYLIRNGLYSNLTEINFLGSGCYGDAYIISNDKILKITTDIKEAENAVELIGQVFNNTIRIFDVEYDEENNHFLILQERLNTNNEDILMGSLYLEAGFEIDNADDEDYLDDFFSSYTHLEKEEFLLNKEKIIKFLKDIENHYSELLYSGIMSSDVHSDNIGQNKNGDYVVFDVSYNNSLLTRENEYIRDDIVDKINEKNEKYLKEILRGLGVFDKTTIFFKDLENHTLQTENSTIEVYKSPISLLSLDEGDIYSPKIIEIKKRNEFYIVETEKVDYSIDSYVKEVISRIINDEESEDLEYDKNYGKFYNKIRDVIDSFNTDDNGNKLELVNFSMSAYDVNYTLEVLYEANFGLNENGEIRIKNIVLNDYLDHNNIYYLDDSINEIFEKHSKNKYEENKTNKLTA